MIVANEYNFTQSMLDKGIDLKIIRELRREFKGWRIYFRGKVCEYDDIQTDYKQMLKTGYTRSQAINHLCSSYEKSMERVKDIVNKSETSPI